MPGPRRPALAKRILHVGDHLVRSRAPALAGTCLFARATSGNRATHALDAGSLGTNDIGDRGAQRNHQKDACHDVGHNHDESLTFPT